MTFTFKNPSENAAVRHAIGIEFLHLSFSLPFRQLVARVMQVKKHFFFAISSIIKPEPFLLLALLSRWALSKVVMTQKFEPWVEFRLWKTNYFYFSQTFWWLSWASSYEHINHLSSCMIVRSFTSPQRHERQLFSPKKSHLPLSSYEMVK